MQVITGSLREEIGNKLLKLIHFNQEKTFQRVKEIIEICENQKITNFKIKRNFIAFNLKLNTIKINELRTVIQEQFYQHTFGISNEEKNALVSSLSLYGFEGDFFKKDGKWYQHDYSNYKSLIKDDYFDTYKVSFDGFIVNSTGHLGLSFGKYYNKKTVNHSLTSETCLTLSNGEITKIIDQNDVIEVDEIVYKISSVNRYRVYVEPM